MILQMYAVKDELNGFAPPIPITNDELAKRYLRELYENNPTVKTSPKDFSIWRVGDFDSELGRMIPDENKLIERAENYGGN